MYPFHLRTHRPDGARIGLRPIPAGAARAIRSRPAAYYYNGYPVGVPMNPAPVSVAPPTLAPAQYVPTAQLVEVGGVGPQNGAYDAVDGPQGCCKPGVKTLNVVDGVVNTPLLRGKIFVIV
nr:unnamed protein product [Callosobruchus chinensis]